MMFASSGRSDASIAAASFLGLVLNLVAACVLVAVATAARAVDVALSNHEGDLLQPYEPTTAGYTKDGRDVPFMDLTLSLKCPLLPKNWISPNGLFLAFTGRFGFYWGTRYSSPVVGKSYNPKLIWRYLPSVEDRPSAFGKSESREYAEYLDFAYAHQSNGQTISTAVQYDDAQRVAERPDFANDYISRGWDYLEVVWKRSYGSDKLVS